MTSKVQLPIMEVALFCLSNKNLHLIHISSFTVIYPIHCRDSNVVLSCFALHPLLISYPNPYFS